MRRRCVMLLPLVLVGLVGCAPVIIAAAGIAGASAIVWHRGWLEQTLPTPHERVYRAARHALDDLDIVLESETLEADRGVLDGYDAESRRVMVKTLSQGEKSTQVRIRVGLWGDQARSVEILEQLKKHL